ncbi:MULTISPECIES: hypothetical protein [unclassified Frankia]|uniref:TRAFAC clade GTPase domain-containing protein n=1 Tax=unclassified Frankia TaxID=2632575 RepID=UPI0009765686|nr:MULTISPECIES: hypothetical protein [unclassified Frankia]
MAKDVAQFTIVVVGAQGAGKTAYLAALFESLESDPDGRGYYISTDMATTEWLNPLAEVIRKPGSEWPESTRWVKPEIEFTCFVPIGGSPFPIMRIRYVDYPGEYLTETPEGAEEQRDLLEKTLTSADALLAMIDGRELLAVLRGEERGEDYLRTKLRPTVQRVQATSCPVHLLVTKWDLLADAGYSLAEVRDRLLDVGFVRGMVRARRPVAVRGEPMAGGVRLIPVSVLGRGVAELTTEPDGVDVMTKRADVEPHPINLDVPLSAILPDRVEQVFASLSPRTLRGLRRAARRRRRRQAGQRIRWLGGETLRIAGRPLQVVIGLALGRQAADISEPLVEYLVEMLARSTSTGPGTISEDRHEVEEMLHRLGPIAANSATVLRSLLLSFAERVADFDQGYPGWNLVSALEKRPLVRPGRSA